MSGKKKKSAKPSSTKPRIPKRIAGVKLPKELRKSGNLLLETAASPVGRELLVSGLMAVVAGAAARRAATPAPQPVQQTAAVAPAPTTPLDPEEAGARAARQVIDLIGGAATAALARYRAELRAGGGPVGEA